MRVAVTKRICMTTGARIGRTGRMRAVYIAGPPACQASLATLRLARMTSASYAVLDDRGLLEITGADRKSFLQGLVSNDVQKLGPSRALYGAFLTPQGKYLHDFFLVERGEVILLEGERARLPDLLRRLSMFKLRAKVALADVSDKFAIGVSFG